MRLLLAESRPGDDSLAPLLGQLGFTVVTVRSGTDVLTAAETHRPALILLESRIAGMSAWEVSQHLRAAQVTASTPVVTLSNSSKPLLRQWLIDAAEKGDSLSPQALVAAVGRVKSDRQRAYRHEPPPRPELPAIPSANRNVPLVAAPPPPPPRPVSLRKPTESVPKRHIVHRSYGDEPFPQLSSLTNPRVGTRPTVGTSPG